MKYLLLCFYLLFSLTLFSQPPIQWQKTIGGNNADELFVIRQTIDGGFVLGGYSNSNISGDKSENSRGGDDYWIVKVDSEGSIEWEKTIGGSGDDDLFALDQTADSGFIIGGRSYSNISGDKTDSNRGATDYWIVKLDVSGNIQWQKTIGGSGDDELKSIQQTIDGGYIIGGTSDSNISGDKTENSKGNSDYWVLKLDSLGNILWQKTIGGNSTDWLNDVSNTTDKGIIIGGWSISNISGNKTENNISGSVDYWVVKLDSNGIIQWQNTIGGNDDDEIESLRQTNDNGYILGGFSNSNISGDKTENSRGFLDYWVIKLDSLGKIQWQKTIGGNKNDYLFSVEQSAEGGFLVGGFTASDSSGEKTENSKGFEDYWLVKLDDVGNILWQKTIGGNGDDELRSLQITSDGGFILAGSSLSDISGDKSENSKGASDYWILKYLKDNTSIEEISSDFQIHLFPNPTTTRITVSFKNANRYSIVVINQSGEKYYQSNCFDDSIQIDVQNLSEGIYFLLISDERRKMCAKKFIKIKNNN